jgi:hypothetical protein
MQRTKMMQAWAEGRPAGDDHRITINKKPGCKSGFFIDGENLGTIF